MSNIILKTEEVKAILAETLKDALGQKDYSNPTRKFVEGVINEQKEEIESVVRKALQEVLSDPEFKDIVRQEFKHKVAKMLVSDLTGSVEKAVNSFRQNPTLRADMVKAIEALVSDSPAPQAEKTIEEEAQSLLGEDWEDFKEYINGLDVWDMSDVNRYMNR